MITHEYAWCLAKLRSVRVLRRCCRWAELYADAGTERQGFVISDRKWISKETSQLEPVGQADSKVVSVLSVLSCLPQATPTHAARLRYSLYELRNVNASNVRAGLAAP